MSATTLLPLLADDPSPPYPTAADLFVTPVVRRAHGNRSWTEIATVYCRGTEIGRLQTLIYPAGAGIPERAIRHTTRTDKHGRRGPSYPSHDIEWLLREHIDHDLDGRRRRLARIAPGQVFLAREAFALNGAELKTTTNWYVPMTARLTVLQTSDTCISFRWDLTWVSTDTFPRRDFVHQTEDTLPRTTFEHLVAERLLIPF